ncbi:MAG: hypothetical protein KDA25_11705, partial [Phycisphaerales bacterium]|nr:hypothetical protein [Phycisphaerales bacterium]
LSGRYLGQPRAFSFTFGFERANVRNAFVPRLWASRRIAMLVDEVRQAGASSAAMPATPAQLRSGEPRLRELTDEILRLSTRFGILTEYTAFLATDGTDLANKEALILGCSTNLRSRAVQDRSGLSAVNQGLNLKSQREQGWVNNDNRYFDAEMKEVAIYSVQQVCDRAFFRRGDQWIDARLFEGVIRLEPDEIVTWGSDRFHDIARRLTAQGRPGVLSLTGASSILMLFDGRVVRIDSPC